MTLISRSATLDHSQLRIPLDLSACFAFGALAALIFNPLLGSRAALVFLFFGGLLLAIKPIQSLTALLRYWPLLVLPAFCLFSALWSEFPGLTVRYSIQLAITFAVAIVIATRVSPATLLRCLFGIYGIGILGSLLFGRVRDDIGAWVGLFGSKNAFAAVAAGLAICSIALLLDRSASRLLRLAALGALISAGPVLVLAQSVGSMTIVLPAIMVAIAIMASRWMSGGQKVLAMIVVALVAIVGSMLLIVHGDALFANYLEFSGKDVTLTGRTDLWEVGFELIGESPWLGLGYQAFWVQGNQLAEALWAMFGIEARSGFNFHNTYINNAVEIGMIGVAIQVLILYGAYFRLWGWALRAPNPENAFLAAFLTFVIASSFIEVVVFFQFSIASIVAIAAFVYVSRYREWLKAGSPGRQTASPAEARGAHALLPTGVP